MKAIHKKTQEVYYIKDVATNTTNAQDGQIMVIYYNGRGQMFAREQFEFFEKFDVGVDCKTDLLDTCIRAIADENRYYRKENSNKTTNAKMTMSKDTESAFNIANSPLTRAGYTVNLDEDDDPPIKEVLDAIDKTTELVKNPLIIYNQAEYFKKFSEESIYTCFINDISPKAVQNCFDKIVARKDQPAWDSYSKLKIELARKKIGVNFYLYYHFLLCYTSIAKDLPVCIGTVYQLPSGIGQELIRESEKQRKK